MKRLTCFPIWNSLSLVFLISVSSGQKEAEAICSVKYAREMSRLGNAQGGAALSNIVLLTTGVGIVLVHSSPGDLSGVGGVSKILKQAYFPGAELKAWWSQHSILRQISLDQLQQLIQLANLRDEFCRGDTLSSFSQFQDHIVEAVKRDISSPPTFPQVVSNDGSNAPPGSGETPRLVVVDGR